MRTSSGLGPWLVMSQAVMTRYLPGTWWGTSAVMMRYLPGTWWGPSAYARRYRSETHLVRVGALVDLAPGGQDMHPHVGHNRKALQTYMRHLGVHHRRHAWTYAPHLGWGSGPPCSRRSMTHSHVGHLQYISTRLQYTHAHLVLVGALVHLVPGGEDGDVLVDVQRLEHLEHSVTLHTHAETRPRTYRQTHR